MGAIDTGIVTPARTIIQNNLLVDDKTGIWLITIYTLAYAASIPVMGKLADRYGRKTIYITSIFLFGLGSLLCGLSHYAGSFELLIAARAIQAIGGGGIMPVATAEFGTSFPPEKRGLALGLVGGVYGIANIFGSLAGSAILDLFGTQNWQYIFFVNIPISIFIIIAGFFCLPNRKEKVVKKIDGLGTLVIVALVLSLLYGLKQIDFFDFANTITSTRAYPFLIAFAVLVPVFVFVEKRAEDPIMNLSYFTNARIVTTLAVAFASGFVLMGIVFIPQFCENSLKVSSGNGGYFTVVLGLLSGVSAMLSGKLIDKFGAKLVLLLGFSITIIGAMFLIFVAAVNPSMATVIISLMLLGFGMGFTIGAPVNYMMLENVNEKEANSGLATLSLIRSIGTSIAPAIMVGFLAYAGTSVQAKLMPLMPDVINVPSLPYVQEISDKVTELKTDPNMAEKLGDMEIPDVTSMQTIKLDFSGGGDYQMPTAIIEKLKSSDVTTIVAITKEMAVTMFDEMTPAVVEKIQSGLNSGVEGITQGIAELDASVSKIQAGYSGIGQGITGMQSAVAAQTAALTQLQGVKASMTQMLEAGGAWAPGVSVADMLPMMVKSSMPASALSQLSEIKSMDELNAKIAALQGAIAALNGKIASSVQSQTQMSAAIAQMTAAKAEMETLLDEMNTLNSAIPGAFETAKTDYIAEIDAKSGEIEEAYQSTVNTGYRSIYVTASVSAVIAILLLIFYKKKKPVAEISAET
ncbi:MAG: MFS transporter [Oscillospiraceae bacterium]|nr:MFS transporter [Oscillospiraceae bacterium]